MRHSTVISALPLLFDDKSAQMIFWIIVASITVLSLIGYLMNRRTRAAVVQWLDANPPRFEEAASIADLLDQDWHAVAHKMGFTPVSSAPESVLLAIEPLIQGVDDVECVMVRDDRSGSCTLCQVISSIRMSSGSSDNQKFWIHQYQRTVLLFTSTANISLPTFHVLPAGARLRSGLLGHPILIRWANSLAGVHSVNFDEDPEFSEQRQVSTVMPDVVRPLLTKQVREQFLANDNLAVSAGGQTIVVYVDRWRSHFDRRRDVVLGVQRHGDERTVRLIQPNAWPAFIAQANKLVTSICSEAATKSRDPTYARSVGQQNDTLKLKTIVEPVETVSAQAINEFLRQSPLRIIPKPIRRAARDPLRWYMRMFGGMFILVPCILCIGLAIVRYGSSLLGYLIIVPASLVGILSIYFCLIYPFQQSCVRRRILVSGTVASAIIEKVKRTGNSYYSESKRVVQYEIKFKYHIEKKDRSATIHAYGDQVLHGESLRESQATTRILWDARYPKQIVWIDGFQKFPNPAPPPPT